MTSDDFSFLEKTLQKDAVFKIINPPVGMIDSRRLPHVHPYWELKILSRGNIELVPPGIVHPSSAAETLSAVISISVHELSVNRGTEFLFRKFRIGEYAPILTELLELCRKVPSSNSELRQSLFMTFNGVLLRVLNEGKDLSPEKENPCERATAFLYAHHHDPNLSIQTLAERMGCSVQYLNRLFRKTGNTTAHKVLLKIRLEHAHELLEKGYSVGETAALTGWHGQFHFSRMFKKYYGIPPAIIREKHEND